MTCMQDQKSIISEDLDLQAEEVITVSKLLRYEGGLLKPNGLKGGRINQIILI